MEVNLELGLPPFSSHRLAEILTLVEEIFGNVDQADFVWRLRRLPDVSVGLASDASGLVGFKCGYAVTSRRYYSWLGGVADRARRRGVARRLMEWQHSWLQQRGYESIETAAEENNEAMLELNREFGFQVIGTYERSGSRRVLLHLRLPRSDSNRDQPER